MQQDRVPRSATASTNTRGWPNIETPLTEFSDCHADILIRLAAFDELPAMIATAERARTVAADTVALFEHAVLAHHGDEEAELFPAVLRWASEGEELARVKAMVQRLTAEHRAIERLWKRHRSEVEAAARGKPSNLQKECTSELVQAYRDHAVFEEQVFLPLSRKILQRDSDHMAALAMSLHLRHAPRVPGYI
jgi:hemerythrin-like domain-containing protein